MLPTGNSHEVDSFISHEDSSVGLNATELNSKREYLVSVWSHGGKGVRGHDG